MRKNIISLAAAMTLVLSAAPAWSQAEQRTVVRKTIVDNSRNCRRRLRGKSASRAKWNPSSLGADGSGDARCPGGVGPNPDFCRARKPAIKLLWLPRLRAEAKNSTSASRSIGDLACTRRR